MYDLPTGRSRSSAEFANPMGVDLLARTEGFAAWRQERLNADTWTYARALTTAASTEVELAEDSGQLRRGYNFASQDYLALSSHPAIHEAAVQALRDFGPHSAGSPALAGNSTPSRALTEEIVDFLGATDALLYPTGWAAGFGAITALVRPYDHVVIDRLAHACLHQGAQAATPNVVRHEHLSVEGVERALQRIRAADDRNGILVVTEGLFSMDADTPDLASLQAVCRVYDATLMVDVAHDLGATGPGGTGSLGQQGLLGKVDLVMGSFSKTFASNGGFVATRSAAAKQYLRYYGGPHLFSNAISPLQAAVVRAALRIVRSSEGDALRARLAHAVEALRSGLEGRGLRCLGVPSPIVPVEVGDEQTARLAASEVSRRGVLVNLVEYPAVAVGKARFRLQVMAAHEPEQAEEAARVIAEVVRTRQSAAA